MSRQIEPVMLRLTDGARIMRFVEPVSGICLETKLDEQQPVLQQERHWKQVFASMIERELGTVG